MGETFESALSAESDSPESREAPALIGLHAFELAPVIRRILHASLSKSLNGH